MDRCGTQRYNTASQWRCYICDPTSANEWYNTAVRRLNFTRNPASRACRDWGVHSFIVYRQIRLGHKLYVHTAFHTKRNAHFALFLLLPTSISNTSLVGRSSLIYKTLPSHSKISRFVTLALRQAFLYFTLSSLNVHTFSLNTLFS